MYLEMEPVKKRRDLTRQKVVARALELADSEGIEAITMRRLGGLLDVEGMALYTHVQDKDDLLAAVGELLLAELDVEPRPREDWRGRITAVSLAWAAIRTRHPRAFPLVFRARREVLPVTEEMMDALRTAGFDESRAALAYQTLVFFLDPPLLRWPNAEPREIWTDVARHVDEREFPHFHESARHAHEFTWDDVYANGLRLLLDGLERDLGP